MIKVIVIVALVVLALAFFLTRSTNRVSGEEARQLVAQGATLLDVRTPAEFGSHHIDGARNIPVADLQKRVAELGDTSKPVVVYCRSGARSGRASSVLKSRGYDVHDLGPISRW